MAMSPEQSMRLEQIRAKALRNEATEDELIEGITLLTADRESAQIASTAKRTAKAADSRPIDSKALLAGLSAKLKGGVFSAPAGTISSPQAELPKGAFKL